MNTHAFNARTLRALEFGKVLDTLSSLASSEAGQAACLNLAPCANRDTVSADQKLFDETRTWASRKPGQSRLGAFADLSGLLRHVESPTALLEADALWAVREVVLLSRTVTASIEECGDLPALTDLAHASPPPSMTASALARCLGDDGAIRDESSPELMTVRSELRRLHQGCLRRVKEFAVQYNIGQYLQDDFMTLASDRYVLPLKSNFKGRVQGIIHDYSNTGETCYFEPMFLVAQNNRLQELKHEEREEERKVLLYLTGLVRDERVFIQGTWDFLVRLDVYLAKCRLAETYDGVCVPLGETRRLELLEARHPLLALDPELRKHGGPQPLDLVLREDDRGLVISGGNAGGKTVCLKTLGLMAAMTLAGLPIPVARGSIMPLWSSMHAFIGDEQSLADHVSTFTAQIRYLSDAWASTGPDTLVLLDEFGAGTDPAQGAALAQAVLDELLARDAHVVAATHFPALKTYALTRDRVRAASVLFDPSTKRPLFRLAYDQVGASQALDVAREHGLPEAVLRRAHQYLLLDGEDTGPLLARLNALAAEREQEAAVLRDEQARLRDKRHQMQERFEKERERLHAEVRKLSAEVLAGWKEHKISHKQALKSLAAVRASLTRPLNPEGETERAAPGFSFDTLKVGQAVLHKPWGKTAEIRELDSRQQRAKLDMNGVSLWADISLLGPVHGDSAPRARGGATLRTSSAEISYLRLDLRGKRADLAMNELGQYLDRALLSGREGVEIVHGRGTGVLRKEVHSFLRTFPGIAAFAPAPEDQGGDGVTVVTFK